MEVELQRTREAIQKHAEEMIGLLLQLETRLESRLLQAQARIAEIKKARLAANSSEQHLAPTSNGDLPKLPLTVDNGDDLLAVAHAKKNGHPANGNGK